MRNLRDAALRGVRVRLLVDDLYTGDGAPMVRGLAKFPNVPDLDLTRICGVTGRRSLDNFIAARFWVHDPWLNKGSRATHTLRDLLLNSSRRISMHSSAARPGILIKSPVSNSIRQCSKRDHVRPSLRDSRALIALILPALCGAPLASAEIFKCVSKDGTPLYQNFPCQFDSIGWVPPNSQGVKTPPAAPGPPQAKPSAPSTDTASTVASADPRHVRVGMTPEEVKAILGEPMEVVEEGPADRRTEIWRYVDRTLQLDHTHHVTTVEAW